MKKFLVTSSACVYPRYCTIPTPESEGFKDEPEPTNSGYENFIRERLIKNWPERYSS